MFHKLDAYFNLATIMKLVEVITTENTPPGVVEYVMNIVINIGKMSIEVHKAPGFEVNRKLIPMINEAVSICAGELFLLKILIR